MTTSYSHDHKEHDIISSDSMRAESIFLTFPLVSGFFISHSWKSPLFNSCKSLGSGSSRNLFIGFLNPKTPNPK